MVQFEAIIKKFESKGEKTGWSYIEISPIIIQQLKGNYKKSFRIKGQIDDLAISKIALIPMGEGKYILPIKVAIRKKINKIKGDKVILKIQVDDSEIPINPDFMSCLIEDLEAMNHFQLLPTGHKNYFNTWINSSKTPETTAKRIAMALDALANKRNFGQMIRSHKTINN